MDRLTLLIGFQTQDPLFNGHHERLAVEGMLLRERTELAPKRKGKFSSYP